MPRAKKPVTAADCIDPVALVLPGVKDLLDKMQGPVLAAAQRLAERVTLKYSDEDMLKLDQFAIGLLGDTSTSTGCILEGRIRAAYLRAEVMLTVRKEIAALEV